MLTTAQKIKHLYWRAGFGYSSQEWKKIQQQSLEQAINQLFNTTQDLPKIDSVYQEQAEVMEEKGNSKAKKAALEKDKQLLIQQNAQWIQRMANPSANMLLEKMSFFWHGHFACVFNRSKLAYQQLHTIRQHALGNFRTLVKAIARDPAMIRFLNNQQNRKRQPNENFARELMELFTIGRGNYTEQDIKEAARAFTGWSSDFQGNFKFRRLQHDYDKKTFMGKTGSFDGDDIIDIILERRETAHFIVKKIYRFFVNENINEQRVDDLTDFFYQTDYDISKLMRKIFSSEWFYESPNVGTKIKSPIELIAGLMRSLDVKFEGPMPLLFVERALGQVLFRPPNVAGWPGGQKWIDNATLIFRLNLAGYLFQAAEVNFRVKEEFEAKRRNKAIRKIKASVNLTEVTQLCQGLKEAEVFSTLQDYYLQTPSQLNLAELKKHLSQHKFIESLSLRLLSLPEYQLC